MRLSRRQILCLLPFVQSACVATRGGAAGTLSGTLPLSARFKGIGKFRALCRQAQAENWAALPIGPRVIRVATGLRGTPYANWTLEIDDHVEAPSADFTGMDCWTAYEIPLAFARMIAARPAPWQPEDLLAWIELERYRGGHCDGTYLSRMHYLEEVFHDNQSRGLAENITAGLPGAVILQRRVSDMTDTWTQFRYLRADPKLVAGITRMEQSVSALPVWHVPKDKVAGIESLLAPGDILAITGDAACSYTTHVGLAVPQPGGTTLFQHATSSHDKGRKVILDRRISEYLAESPSHAGLVVCRPR